MKRPTLDKARTEWLAQLPNDSEVAWISEHNPARLVKIRRSRDCFVADDEKEMHCRATFTLATGKGRAGTFRSTEGWIVPVTPDLRRESAVEEARDRLRGVVFSRYATPKVSDDVVLAIAALL